MNGGGLRRAGAIVALAGIVARPCGAHEAAVGDVVPALDHVPARLAGVTVQLQHTLAHQLVVENRTARVLEVLGEDGVPFLRLGPNGAEANLAATGWYRTASAEGGAIPASAGSGDARWVRVGAAPSWGWFDRRVRPDDVVVPHAVRHAGRPAGVGRWTIPLRLGGAPVKLAGTFRFEPRPAGAFASRLTSPDEPFPGVRVRVVDGRVPALYLENAGTQPVTVVGTSGEPFLSIGPDGTRANLLSPTWQRSGKAEVTDRAMPIDAGAEPVWQLQSASPRYAWIEFRAARPAGDAATATGSTDVVGRWGVPLRRGPERAVVSGVVEWVPALPGADRKVGF
jgi:hypothetical protein